MVLKSPLWPLMPLLVFVRLHLGTERGKAGAWRQHLSGATSQLSIRGRGARREQPRESALCHTPSSLGPGEAGWAAASSSSLQLGTQIGQHVAWVRRCVGLFGCPAVCRWALVKPGPSIPSLLCTLNSPPFPAPQGSAGAACPQRKSMALALAGSFILMGCSS